MDSLSGKSRYVNTDDEKSTHNLFLCGLVLTFFYLIGLFRNPILDFFGGLFYTVIRIVGLGLFLGILLHASGVNNFSIYTKVRFRSSHLRCGDPLLFVRFMACFFVLMQHGMGVTYEPNNIEKIIWKDGAWLLFPSAWMGVWIFFVLSGYLMGKQFFNGRYLFNPKGIKDFYVNRLIRIVPIYYLAVLVVCMLQMPHIFNSNNIGDLLSVLLFDNSATLKNVPIGALWSIAVEMQYYLGAPYFAAALFFMLNDASDKKCFAMLFGIFSMGLIYRLIIFIDNGNLWFAYVFTSAIGNLDLFSSGMVVAYILQRFPTKNRQMILSTFSLLMLYVLGAFFVSAITTAKVGLSNFSFIGPSITGIITCLIIYLYENAVRYQNTPDKFSGLLIRCTQFLGILTYPIYVFHEPIYLAIKRSWVSSSPSMLGALLFTIIGISLVFILASLIHFVIEKPLSRFKLID